MKTIQNRSIIKASIVAVMVLSTSAGCSAVTQRNSVSDAALSGNTTAMWEEGREVVKTGESLVSKGEKQLEEGRRLIRENQPMITEGNKMVLEARRRYQQAVETTGGSTTPKQVAKESATLKKIGNNWEDAIDSIRKANKRVNKGNDLINKGQSEIRKGRTLIESGSVMMRNSQRLRLGDDLLPEFVPKVQ